MRFVDAHIHLSDEEYAPCVHEVIEEARASDVVAMVSNSMDLETSIRSLELAKRYPGIVYSAVGVHPWSVSTLGQDELERTVSLAVEARRETGLVAVGEVGLDHKYESTSEDQLKVFGEMLRLAERLELPVIVHSRGTAAQILEIIPSYKVRRVLFHWFSGPTRMLAQAVERGCYISEGAPTVYSRGIRDIIEKTPLSNILTETDGPVRFFRPPFNGRRTTPAIIPTVVSAVAEIKKQDVAVVAEWMVKNFEELFAVRTDPV